MRRIGAVLAVTALALVAVAPAAASAATPADDAGRSWEVVAARYVPPPEDVSTGTASLTFLSADDGSVRQTTLQPEYIPVAIVYAPDARTVYTIGYGGDLDDRQPHFAAHDAVSGAIQWSTDVTEPIRRQFHLDVAVSPDGSVAITTGSGEVKIDLMTRAVEQFQACADGIARGAAFSPDGRTAWFLCDPAELGDGIELRAFDVATLNLVRSIVVPGILAAGRIAITPDGSTAVVAGAYVVEPDFTYSTVRVDLASGAFAQVDVRSNGGIAISPDGARAYVGAQSLAWALANPGEPTPPEELFPATPVVDPETSALHAIDIAAATATSVPLQTSSANPAVTPDGAQVYALIERWQDDLVSGGLSIHEGATLNGLGEIPLDGVGYGLAITPDQAPIARLTASTPNSPVTFDASASTVEFGTIAEYAWDFGDGATTVTTTPVVEHEYAEPGQYTATVRLTSSGGTSTEDVYTGHQLLRNGDPSAIASVTVTVPLNELPPTGFDGAWLVIGAFGMLAAGTIAMLIARRRVQH